MKYGLTLCVTYNFAGAICIINEQWSLKNNFPWIFLPTMRATILVFI